MKLTLPVFALILVLAVAARLGVMLVQADDLRTDPDGYIAHAQVISDGHGFAGPSTKRPTAFRPPGYPYLIAWWPGSKDDPARAVAMIHIVAGVLTVLLTRQLGEEIGLAVAPSNLAACIVALDPLLVRYSALPMTEVTSALALTASLVMMVRFRKWLLLETAGNAVYCGRLVAAFCGGGLLGLTALIRPVGLLVCGLLTLDLIYAVLRRQVSKSGDNERIVRHRRIDSQIVWAILPALAFSGILLPWVLRNYIVFNAFIPATTHGGYTLSLGNNSDYYHDVVEADWSKPWDGRKLDEWQNRMITLSSESGVADGDEVASDQFMYSQAKAAIAANPNAFLLACVLRVKSFWALTPTLSRGEFPSAMIAICQIGYASVWLMVFFAAIHQCCVARLLTTTSLWLTLVAFQMIHTVYWTDTRMRAPVMPVLAVLAASGVQSFVKLFRPSSGIPKRRGVDR